MKFAGCRVFFLVFLVFQCVNSWSQSESTLDSNISICSSDSNYIYNDENLLGFFTALDSLKRGYNKKVNILHIGDSHIQGDYMSRTVRYRFQQEFGEGGRGMVFPYSLLNMYGPVDYKSNSNVIWENDRIFPREKKFSVGVVGYALATNNRAMSTRIDLTGPPKSTWGALTNFDNYPSNEFDLVKLLYSNDSNDLPLKILGIDKDNNIGFSAELPQYSESYNVGFQIAPVFLGGTYKSIYLKADTSRKFTESVQLYGLIFENTKSDGIVYHMAGVGACQLNNFLKATHFVNQTIAIKPNLIIISLGANESVSPGWDTILYVKKYVDLIEHLKKEIPGVSILLTTPPDILYKNKLPVWLYPVRRAIFKVASITHCAVWDLHRVMGGERSNYIWSMCKYAGPDRIHFTPKGYDFQGLLLTEALFGSFNNKFPNKVDLIELNSDLAEYRLALTKSYLEVIQKQNTLKSLDTGGTVTKIHTIKTVQPTRVSSSPQYYIVRRGETIYSISRRFHLNFKTVLKINGLTENSTIRPGQRIKLR